MPVGEGSAGQKISFYIVKRPLDPGFSVGVVNSMRPKMKIVDPGKGLHFRGERGIWASAVTDNHAGIIDHTAVASALHICHGLSQKCFAFKPGKSRVVLDKKLTAIGQGKASALGSKQTATYFESMRRSVMLHLRARLKMVASGPLLRGDAQLIFTDQPGKALVGDCDIIAGQKFLLNPNDVALAVTEQFANLSDMPIITRVLTNRWPDCRRFEHSGHRVASDLQLSGNQPLWYALFGHFPDQLLFDGVDHIQDAP